MSKDGTIGQSYLQTCDSVTESSLYARADALTTDVIEASVEHGWKLFSTPMQHSVLKPSILDWFDEKPRVGECGVCSQNQVPWFKIDAVLRMKPHNAAQE